MLKSKSGQYAGLDEALPGYLAGAAITFAIVALICVLWGTFFNTGGIDSTTLNTFDLVVNDILDMENLDEPSRNVNVQFQEEYSLVAFGKDTAAVGSCQGLGIIKPAQNCQGACICICLNEQGNNMCVTKNVICRDFDNLELDFEGSCNLVDGTGSLQTVQIRQENGKFTTV